MHKAKPQDPNASSLGTSPTAPDGSDFPGSPPSDYPELPMTPSTPPSSPRCDTAGEDFSIVGVGASAGGLQALRQLLTRLPADTGMAFVIVQHLDPSHPSLLANVLAGETSMAVREAADGTRVQPNRVYVIPPAADLRVKQGVLVLVARQQPGRLHLPIDAFFESLAEDQPGRAIGVVLSGSGSDGTEGLRAIKNAGGITFAQEPASAQFPSMPESALAAGVVDFHLSPLEIAQELVRLSKHPYLIQTAASERTAGFSAAEEGNLEDLLAALRAQSQIDFTGYKQPTVLRRIARRMALRHVATMREYADALRKDPVESRQLAEDILIQVTSFFRDPAAFAALQERVFPELLKHKEEGAPIRIWVAGCASGEEAYSLAICLDEFLERQARKVPIKIFGTDLSSQAIATARLGVYPESKLAGVSPERLARYFDRTEGRYCVSKRIRDCCVFVQHHLTRDPPFAKLDLISCRNVLIYFDAELQQRVFPMLHYCLNRPGFLFLGISEAISGFGNLFTPLDKSLRIYEKTGENQRFAYPLGLGHASEATLFSHTPAERRQPAREVERQADHYLLNRFAPAGVIVNERLEVVQFRGQTGTFLQAPPGQPQLNVVRMARPGLVGPLQAALEQAKTQGGTVRKEGLSLQVDTFSRLVNLEVVPLPNLRQSGERYFLAWFEVVAPDTAALGEPVPATPGTALRPAALPERDNAGLNMEIAATRSYLEALLAEHQTTTDDLAVTNEELVASNEELQSTNEELQGTQEELQSTNEELNTVNDELRNRNQALDLVASDLENVLESVKLPLIIVDGELRIRRFTPMAQLVSNLIAGDVGRSIEEVKLKVKVDDLTQKIQDTLTSLTPKEWDIQGSDDRWFRMQIRPYRGSDKRLDGVLLTFFDVDVLKRSLQAAESARDYARSIVETVQTALVVLDSRLCVVSANRAFCELVQTPVRMTDSVDFFALTGGGVAGARRSRRAREEHGDALAVL